MGFVRRARFVSYGSLKTLSRVLYVRQVAEATCSLNPRALLLIPNGRVTVWLLSPTIIEAAFASTASASTASASTAQQPLPTVSPPQTNTRTYM